MCEIFFYLAVHLYIPNCTFKDMILQETSLVYFLTRQFRHHVMGQQFAKVIKENLAQNRRSTHC